MDVPGVVRGEDLEPQVVYSPASIGDLAEIWDYVALDSLLQADRLIDRFRLKLQYLARHEHR